MKNPICFVLLSIFFVLPATPLMAQQAHGGGHYEVSAIPCILPSQKDAIERDIQRNRAWLIANGNYKTPKKTRVSLAWPLQQVAGSPYCSYYGISNFVDHDVNYPNQLKDFNCGTRTYDLATGYNHGGADIFLWPFDWNMMQAQQVEVIAAAPGTIVAKYDGNTDTNCDFSNPNWNAIFVEHSDGTVAWYGHMKNGSLNVKPVGASVVAGEKLGLVASSGASTGPHLHFELHDIGGNVIDPFAGACNPGGSNLWATPRTYYDPGINAAFTHDAPPVYNNCPALHTPNRRDTFMAGEDIYFVGYFHDQLTNLSATYTVKRPDNSIFATWNHIPPQYYVASYWYWQYTLPANPQYGTWTYSITLNGMTCNHPFTVLDPAALSITEPGEALSNLRIVPNPAGDHIFLPDAREPIDIFDLSGRCVGKYAANDRIDITGYQQGIYVVHTGQRVGKLIVTR